MADLSTRMERAAHTATRRERLADLRHWHERSPSSYQALPEMAGWVEEAWATIDDLTADLDQAQRDLATVQASGVKRRLEPDGFIVLPPLPGPDDFDPSPYR